MKAECRGWRELLGARALGGLDHGERPGLEAHLEGCAECSAEAASLDRLAATLPLADPARAEAEAPPGRMRETIITRIHGERRQRRRRVGLRLALAAACVSALGLAVALRAPGPGDGHRAGDTGLAFAADRNGVEIAGTLVPASSGTQIRMGVEGVRSGTLCRVFLVRRGGGRSPAGGFRYRSGGDSQVVLTSALDLAETAAVAVLAGGRAYSVRLGRGGAGSPEVNEYEETT